MVNTEVFTWLSTWLLIEAPAYGVHCGFESHSKNRHWLPTKTIEKQDDKSDNSWDKNSDVFGAPEPDKTLRIFFGRLQYLFTDGVGLRWAVVRFDEEEEQTARGFCIHYHAVNSLRCQLHAHEPYYSPGHQAIEYCLSSCNCFISQGFAKICDFGWSVFNSKQLRSTLCGTPLYLSP